MGPPNLGFWVRNGPKIVKKIIQTPMICMKSSYLTSYYPHFIDFKMLRLIWTKMAETPKICKNGRSALIWPKAKVINL